MLWLLNGRLIIFPVLERSLGKIHIALSRSNSQHLAPLISALPAPVRISSFTQALVLGVALLASTWRHNPTTSPTLIRALCTAGEHQLL